MIRFAAIFLLLAGPAFADAYTTVRVVRPTTVILPEDILALSSKVPGAFSDAQDVVGMEARVTLYPGRPILPGQIGRPALVSRNQIVELVYTTGSLRIQASGRALARGAVGDVVRVMNTASRNTVTGTVTANGRIMVSGSQLGIGN